MMKQELQQAIEGMQQHCIQLGIHIVITPTGRVLEKDINGNCPIGRTAAEVATRLTDGHERRCHEALVKEIETVDFSHAWAGVLHERLKESKQALAEGV